MRASPTRGGDRAVLEDATGRRGRWMRRLGRATALLVFGWLVVLLLGGLGLTPVADLRFAEVLRPSQGPEPLAATPKPRRPPAADLRPARPIATATTSPTVTRTVSPPSRSNGQQRIRIARPIESKAGGGPRRAPRRTIVAPAPVEPATTPPPPPSPTARPGRSAEAPGHSGGLPPGRSAVTPVSPTTTMPGRSASAPGQVKKAETATTTTVATTTSTPAHGPKEPKKP
jgi:hypothetical protein